MSKPATSKKRANLTTRQAAQIILVQVMQVLPKVESGKQAEVVSDVTGELLRLPLVKKS